MKKSLFVMFGIFAAVAIAYSASFVVADSPITTISIVNDAFSPQYTTVQAGTSVLWINSDVHYHSIVSNDDYFNSGTLYSGGTFQYTFGTPGVYYYHDTSFNATGVITVTSSSSYQNSYSNNYSNNTYAYGYNGNQNYTQTGLTYNYTNTLANQYTNQYANQYTNQYAYANPTYSYPAQTYVGTGTNYNNYYPTYSTTPATVANYNYSTNYSYAQTYPQPYTQTAYVAPTYAAPQMITPIYYPSSATYTQQYIYNPTALASYSYSNYPYIYPYYTTSSYGNYSGNYYKPESFNLSCISESYGYYNSFGGVKSYNCLMR